MSEPSQSRDVPLIACPICGQEVPDATYCGACGAHLHSEVGNGVHRYHAYAADPSQHVIHPSIVTTLFPHLPHRRRLPFQLALGLTVLALLVLGGLRWTAPSVALACFALPLIYLIQLWEVEVYEDEPVLIVGATLVFGAVLGGVWAHFTGAEVTHLLVENTTFGVTGGRLLEGAVLLPLAGQVLMLIAGLALYFRRRYDEALDGFTFGVAGALGFTMASTFVNLIPELQQGWVSSMSPTDSVLDALQRGLLVPVISASVTGLICGALWLRRGPTHRLPYHTAVAGLVLILAMTVAVRVLLGVESIVYVDYLSSVAANGLAAVLLIVWVRIALHYMLLAEAVEVTIGPDLPCSHCHRIVPRMAFCPNCGVATRATPKSGSGRSNRVARQGAL